MRQRLKHWLFQRGKNCKHCCLWCEYFNICSWDMAGRKERKKMRGVEDETEIMTRREAVTEKGTERDQESAPRSREVGVMGKRRSTKKTRRTDDTEMTKKSPRKNTAEAGAERGNAP